jgi:hypothetical protein
MNTFKSPLSHPLVLLGSTILSLLGTQSTIAQLVVKTSQKANKLMKIKSEKQSIENELARKIVAVAENVNNADKVLIEKEEEKKKENVLVRQY